MTVITMELVTQRCLSVYLWFCLIALIVYLPRIAYYFVAFVKQKKLVNPEKNRIAVIIPARNESAVIAQCLDSLARQTYDSDYYDIHVVIADENDPTKGIAAGYANTYVTVVREQKSKGEALDGVLKKILRETPDKYDAYLIVDADNIADCDLVKEMNNALGTGKQIICGKKLIKNWMPDGDVARNFISNCTALTYIQVDDLGNLARNYLGFTMAMIGTGMTVRADVIKENDGWPYRTLTEDYEMTADAILHGWSSYYYTHAKVHTEESLAHKTAYKRKMRWIKGYSQCIKKYFWKIVSGSLTGKIPFKSIGFIVGTLPAYAFFGVSLFAFLFGAVTVVLSLLGGTVGIGTALNMLLIPLLLIYGALFVLTVFTLLCDRKNMTISRREKLALLFFNPIYSLEYVKIFPMAFFTGDDFFKWESTSRMPVVPHEKEPEEGSTVLSGTVEL